MTNFKSFQLINRDVVGEAIVLTNLNAKTVRGAKRAAKNYLKTHDDIDGIVQIGYKSDLGEGHFEIDE